MPRYDCLAYPASRIPARAAVVPLMAYAMIVVRRTGTPDSVATVRSLPIAYRWRPNAVRRSTMSTTTASTSHTPSITGNTPMRPLASHWSAAGDGGGGKPRVITSSTPWSTTSMARVITMGGIRNRAIPTPLMMPTSAPKPSTSGTAHRSAPSLLRVREVTSIAAPVSVQGIDRSMPPPMMTMVWPMATMPMNEAPMMSVATWAGAANPGE